jgi:hypothetical protein
VTFLAFRHASLCQNGLSLQKHCSFVFAFQDFQELGVKEWGVKATLTPKFSEVRFERYSYVFIVAIQFRSFIGSLPDSQGLTSEVSVPETTFPGKDCFSYWFISVRVFWLWSGYWSSYFVGS